MVDMSYLADAVDFACHSKECAPPPVGAGGSLGDGFGGSSVVSKIRNDGGFTVAADGSSPSEGISVSPYPERSVIVPVSGSDADLGKAYEAFLKANDDILGKDGHHAGGWVDGDKLYLDVVKVFPPSQREAAIALGRAKNQIAVWDLGASEEIPTGGTGEA